MLAQENVEVALNLAGRRGQPADDRARSLLSELGLQDRLGFAVDQLAGGEKQRVAIARAVANQPARILADEPTANLDSARGAETMRLLRQLAKDERTTVQIVSHDERLREIADRVLWLADRKLEEIASLERDPVCGMLVAPNRAVIHEHAGKKLFFYAPGCREQYEREHSKEATVIPYAGIQTAEVPR